MLIFEGDEVINIFSRSHLAKREVSECREDPQGEESSSLTKCGRNVATYMSQNADSSRAQCRERWKASKSIGNELQCFVRRPCPSHDYVHRTTTRRSFSLNLNHRIRHAGASRPVITLPVIMFGSLVRGELQVLKCSDKVIQLAIGCPR